MSDATNRQRMLFKAREIWRNGFRTFDTETTGLEWEDQIIQWAVCDQNGKVLGSGNVKPTVPISEGAFEIHGISEEQLADAPSFADVWPTIRDLLLGHTIVIYNANFDIGKILSSGQAYGIEIPYDFVADVCAMEIFAMFYGEYHKYWESYTWQKLTTAISHLGIEILGEDHAATHDAAATAMIIKKLAQLADEELAPGWHPPVLVKCAGGCGNIVKECAEADAIWYCQDCGLKQGVFHCCPGCNCVVEVPTIGFLCDDFCQDCHKSLRQEAMLLTGAWHWCPDHWYPYIVESSDQEELCTTCKQKHEWRLQREEAERIRQERMALERKEARRASAQAYRQRKKARELENCQWAEQGLPPLEVKKAPVDEVINHHGHLFHRQKYDDGSYGLYCSKCGAVWSKLPRNYCAGIKTYRSWIAIPEHLKTRTQLLKIHLKPSEGQKSVAVVDGSFDRYHLYNQGDCVSVEIRAKKTATN